MPKIFIQREIADEVVMKEAMRRLYSAARILRTNIKNNLQHAINTANTREATIKRRDGSSYTKSVPRYQSRPEYKSGAYPGKWWTARDAGELLKSVRVVFKHGDSKNRNILIIAGNSKAYYSAMFEYATDPKRGKKFYRPALASSRSAMKSVIENG